MERVGTRSVVLFLLLSLLCDRAWVVGAQRTVAAHSTASGEGLQLATAGLANGFTVIARDETDARRTAGGDNFLVELEGARSLTASVIDNLDGSYDVSYTVSKNGDYSLGVSLANAGGLSSAYYENVWFFYTPVKTAVQPEIDINWGEGLLTDSAADYVSIRWTGKLKPLFAEPYTFYMTTDDGARLWVDNVPLIDRWETFCNETSATIWLKANAFYSIKMEYKEIIGTAFARLMWASQSTPKTVVPAEQLFYLSPIKDSPFAISVLAAEACGSQTTASGPGFAVATAGTAARATIQCNDAFLNNRGIGGDRFAVTVFPLYALKPDAHLSGRITRGVHAAVADNTDGSYTIEYTSYRSGASELWARLATAGGVLATYYSGDIATAATTGGAFYPSSARVSKEVDMIDFSVSSVDKFFGGEDVGDIDGWSARWVGLITPPADGVFTFLSKLQSDMERVRLWVDNDLIVDQWSSLSGGIEPSGTIDLRETYLYDLKLEYSASKDELSQIRLSWFGGEFAGVQTIPSASLFKPRPIHGSPFSVNLEPAVTCAAQSSASDVQGSLSVATAGLQAKFVITARDLYGNLRMTGGGKFSVRLSGIDANSGFVRDLDNGNYEVLYTATKSGTYDVQIVYGASSIANTPYRLIVQPARRHLSNSFATGQSLTLATAGVASSVTITIRDRHDNWQSNPDVADPQNGAGIGMKYLTSGGTIDQSYSSIPAFLDSVSKVVATPTSLDSPTLVLQYAITRSGAYQLSLGGGVLNSNVHDGEVRDSPFSVSVFPNLACAAMTTAIGAGVSVATAGRATFVTIQARDSYGNDRGTHVGDNFVARIRQVSTDRDSYVSIGTNYRDKVAMTVDTDTGEYSVQFIPTKSTVSQLWVQLAKTGGLHATFYNCDHSTKCAHQPAGSVFSGVGSTMDGLSREWGPDREAERPCSISGDFGVRWQGLLQPSEASSEYTFYLGFNNGGSPEFGATERLRLWVDNALIIDQWSSLETVLATEISATLSFEHANALYDIRLDWWEESSAAHSGSLAVNAIQMQWSSSVIPRQLIPSLRLFYASHVQGSPFDVSVHSNIVSSTMSTVRHQALSLATAGVAATFSVQSKDAFGNLRSMGGDDFDFALTNGAVLPTGLNRFSAELPVVKETGSVYFSTKLTYVGGTQDPQQTRDCQSCEVDYDGACNGCRAGVYEVEQFSQTHLIPSAGHIPSETSELRLPEVLVRPCSTCPPKLNNVPVYSSLKSAHPHTWTGSGGGYEVEYLATKQGRYQVRGQLLKPGGLYAVYFENPDLSDHGAFYPNGPDSQVLSTYKSYMRIDEVIDFDWSGKPLTEDEENAWKKRIGPDYFSVRWEGMIRTDFSEVFTFYSDVDDGVKLWIDGLLVLNFWYSRCSDVAGTIPLLKDTLYDIKMEYQQVSQRARVNLAWRSTSQERQIVPSSHLFTRSSSALLSRLGLPLDVEPGVVCSSVSAASGDGLTIATVGVMSRFTITASDEFGNFRRFPYSGIAGVSPTGKQFDERGSPTSNIEESWFHVRVVPVVFSEGPRPFHASIIDGGQSVMTDTSAVNGDWYMPDSPWTSSFTASYRPTSALNRTGPMVGLNKPHSMDPQVTVLRRSPAFSGKVLHTDGSGSNYGQIIRIASDLYPGGLTATYYDDGGSQRLGRGQPKKCQIDQTIDWSDNGPDPVTSEIFVPVYTSLTKDSIFSARWEGMVRPSLSSAYTFFLSTANPAERTRLWIDRCLVLDTFDSATSLTSSGTIAFSTANGLYNIRLEYDGGARDNIDDGKNMFQLKWENLDVSVPQAWRQNRTVIPSSRLYPLADLFEVLYTADVIGDYNIHVTSARAFGLDATYYDDMTLSLPKYTRVDSVVNFQCSGGHGAWLPSPSPDGSVSSCPDFPEGFGGDADARFSAVALSDKHSFSVRWEGLLLPYEVCSPTDPLLAPCRHSEVEYTMWAKVGEEDERIRLWVDYSLIIDRWDVYEPLSATSFSATISLKSGRYYDVKLEYLDYAGDKAEVKLAWHSESVDELKSETSEVLIKSSRLFRSMHISGSPFPAMPVYASATCATESTVRGTAVTFGTAGVASAFTVQSHDEYGNERQLGGDIYVVRLLPLDDDGSPDYFCEPRYLGIRKECRRTVHGTSTDEEDSSYSARYNATRKGLYRAVSSLTNGHGGLYATYYNLQQVGASLVAIAQDVLYDETIDFSKPVPNFRCLSTSIFDVRWQGFVQPSVSSQYSFKVSLGDDTERLRLWVDNMALIDQWTSLETTGSITASIAFPSSNQLYDIKLDYRVSSSSDPWLIRLECKHAGRSDFSVVPSHKLFSRWDVPNSEVLHILEDATDAGATFATGTGLTIATAGLLASFTISSRDSFGNERGLQEDTYLVEVSGGSVNDAVVAQPASTKPGTFHVSYSTDEAGLFEVAVQRVSASGLQAEYFNNMWLIGDAEESERIVVVDEEVNFDWGEGDVRGGSEGLLLGRDYISIRWSGYFKAELSEKYTFYTQTDEGVRLWLNGALVIDAWDSDGGEREATLDATQDALHRLKMEYRESVGNAYVRLLYASPSIPKKPVPFSAYYHSPAHIWGSPFPVDVHPSTSCSSRSQVSGFGVSAATSGVPAMFSITARDMYGNIKTKWGDTYLVRVQSRKPVEVYHTFNAVGQCPVEDDGLNRPCGTSRAQAGFVENHVDKGIYRASYTSTTVGPATLRVGLLRPGGLSATFYDDDQFGVAAKAYSAYCSGCGYAGKIDWSGTNVVSTPHDSLSGCGFSVRWNGMIRPQYIGEYTFQFTTANTNNERLRLWIDELLVADQWSSLSMGSPSSTVEFSVSNAFYDLRVEYKRSKCETASKHILEWKWDSTFDVITSTRLYNAAEVENGPFLVQVSSDVAVLDSCTVHGEALSISTAGVVSEFTILSRDADGNQRTDGGENFVVAVTSGDNLIQGAVTDVGDGSYTILYQPEVQGIYDIKVFLGESSKSTTLLVEPGSACAASTTVTGVSTSIVTAGTAAVFTIQSKDAHENSRTIGFNEFVVKVTGGVDNFKTKWGAGWPHQNEESLESHSLHVDYIGFEPSSSLGQYRGAFRTTRSGDFKMDIQLITQNGLDVEYYRDRSVQVPVYASHDQTISANWHDGTPLSDVGLNDGFSVKWSGFFKPEITHIHTFYAFLGGVDERVRLWVDDRWVIEQWTSLGGAAGIVKGSVGLVSNTLYDLKLIYKEETGDARVRLEYETGCDKEKEVGDLQLCHTPLTLVPSNRLFSGAVAVSGSPFTLSSHPSYTSGTVSTAIGGGMSLATAGLDASFTIQAKDHLGNDVRHSADVFVVRAQHQQQWDRRDIQGTVKPSSDFPGRYNVEYTPVYKHNALSHSEGGPWHDVAVSLALSGGLYATYYDAHGSEPLDISDHRRQFVSSKLLTSNPRGHRVETIDFSSSDGSVSTNSLPINNLNEQYNVRWRGFVSPKYPETFTFMLQAEGIDSVKSERARLWVDGLLLIDQWSSVSNSTMETGSSDPTATINLPTSNGFYDIKCEYTHPVVGSGKLRLLWSSASMQTFEVISSSRLYQAFDLSWKVAGSAGLTATYYDAYGGATGRLVTLDEVVDWSANDVTDRPYAGSLSNSEYGVRWHGFIRPSRRDEYTFFARVYGSGSESVSVRVDRQLVIDTWDDPEREMELSGTIGFPSSNEFYEIDVQYKNANVNISRLTLLWENLGGEMWMLNESGPLTGGVSSNGDGVADETKVYKGVIRSDRLFQVRSTYGVDAGDWTICRRFPSNCSSGASWSTSRGNDRYLWDFDNFGGCRGVAADECWGQGERDPDVLHVDVKPASLCATASTLHGVAISVSTAGLARTFTLTARDAYQNQRDTVTDSLVAQMWHSDVPADSGESPTYTGLFRHVGRRFGAREHMNLTACDYSPTQPFCDDGGDPIGRTDVKDPNGVYVGSYTITRAGVYRHVVSIGDQDTPGFRATYFARSDFRKPARTRFDKSINFNWGTMSPLGDPSLVGVDNFSVVWEGYLRAPYSELFTFSVEADDGAAIEVQVGSSGSCGVYKLGRAVLTSVQGKQVISALSGKGHRRYTGSIMLRAGELVSLKVYYKELSGSALCKLFWESESLAVQILSAEYVVPNLFPVTGGYTPLKVYPSQTCASACGLRGSGLSTATVGVHASFFIVSRDSYGNDRSKEDDIFHVRLVPASVRSIHRRCSIGGVCTDRSSVGNGLHLSRYMFTGSGDHVLHADLLGSVGGLMATYYESVDFGAPRVASLSPGLNITSSPGYGFHKSLTNAVFSARWEGFISPSTTPISAQYTFSTKLEADDRVKMWIDDVLLIDQWTSLSSLEPDGSIALAVDLDGNVNVRSEFKSKSHGNSSFVVKWKSGGTSSIIAAHNFRPAYKLSGMPRIVTFAAADTCAVTSTRSGDGLTIATAGVQASFRIQALDAYGNIRHCGDFLSNQDIFVSRIFSAVPSNRMCCPGGNNSCDMPQVSSPDCKCDECPSLVRATVHAADSCGAYEVSYAATRAGSYQSVSSIASRGGMYATYYDDATESRLGFPHGTKSHQNLEWSGPAAHDLGVSTGNFTVKWTGFIQPDTDGFFTFSAKLQQQAAMRMWLSGDEVTNGWMSVAPGDEAIMLQTYFALGMDLYDIKLQYAHRSGADPFFSLSWESQGSKQVRISSSRLFFRDDIRDSCKRFNLVGASQHAYVCAGNRLDVNGITYGRNGSAANGYSDAGTVSEYLHVHAQSTCSSSSTASGSSLTVATAGSSALFTVTAIDAFYNHRTVNSDVSFAVDVRSPATISRGGRVIERNPPLANLSLFDGAYSTTRAGAYEIHIRGPGGPISGSPFGAMVFPALTCGSRSIVSGTGLTSSVVGQQSRFSVEARDAYSNTRTLGGDTFVVRVVRVSKATAQAGFTSPEESVDPALSQQSIGNLVNGGAGTAGLAGNWESTVHGAVTPDSSVGDGFLYRGDYTIPSQYPGSQAFLHASHASSAGLHATYFSASDGFRTPVSTAANPHFTSHDFLWPDSASGTSTNACGVTGQYRVRWRGFVVPPSTGLFTFTIDVASADGGLALWVDNRRLLLNNTDLAGTLSSTTVTGIPIQLIGSDIYDICLDLYGSTLNPNSLKLKWVSQSQPEQVVPSDRLLQRFDVEGSPLPVLVTAA